MHNLPFSKIVVIASTKKLLLTNYHKLKDETEENTYTIHVCNLGTIYLFTHSTCNSPSGLVRAEK